MSRETTDTTLVIGFSLHKVITFVAMATTDRYFFVAECRVREYSFTAPFGDHQITPMHPRCPMCFFAVMDVAA